MIDSREALQTELSRAHRLIEYLRDRTVPEEDWEQLRQQATVATVINIVEDALSFVGGNTDVSESEMLSVIKTLQVVTKAFGLDSVRLNRPEPLPLVERRAA
jgi:hypothetical protein